MNATSSIDGLEIGSLAVSLTVAAAVALIGICKRLRRCSSRCDDHIIAIELLEGVERRLSQVESAVSSRESSLNGFAVTTDL